MPLSDVAVRSAKPKDRPYKLADLLQESKELTAIFVTIIKKTKNNLGKQ
jgi:hypothetical protein